MSTNGSGQPKQSVRAFLDDLAEHRVDAALRRLAPGATVNVLPADIEGAAQTVGAAFLNGLSTAFPDLEMRVLTIFETSDGTVIVELKMEGTQAAEFLGAINQEKHLDVDGAWVFETNPSGQISAIRAYWDQNQLYRRLAVKRLDQISIAG